MGFKVSSLAPVIGTALGSAFGGSVGGVIGGGMGQQMLDDENNAAARDFALQQQRMNIDLQREFAQEGIRWKIDDAAQRGISPLAALGASGTSFSPITVGEPSRSNGLASMGQDISRAVASTQTAEERELQSLQIKSAKEDLRYKELTNMGLANELTKSGKPTNPPIPSANSSGMLIAGQGDGPSVKVAPQVVTSHDRGTERGAIASRGFSQVHGGLQPVLSEDLKNRVEDTPREYVYDIGDLVGNNLKPNSKSYYPPHSAGKAHHWEWNYFTQKYIPVPNRYSIWERIGRHSSAAWE